MSLAAKLSSCSKSGTPVVGSGTPLAAGASGSPLGGTPQVNSSSGTPLAAGNSGTTTPIGSCLNSPSTGIGLCNSCWPDREYVVKVTIQWDILLFCYWKFLGCNLTASTNIDVSVGYCSCLTLNYSSDEYFMLILTVSRKSACVHYL